MADPWKQTYYGIKWRCSPKGPYYKKRIRNFITEEDLKTLWFRDKAYLMNRPSIDRKDNDKNYTLDNCRFIELKENQRLGGIFGGRKCRPRRRKKIVQYSLSGSIIKKWHGVRHTANELKINHSNISKCLRGKSKTYGGYIWKYA
jgi:hypothetical protein